MRIDLSKLMISLWPVGGGANRNASLARLSEAQADTACHIDVYIRLCNLHVYVWQLLRWEGRTGGVAALLATIRVAVVENFWQKNVTVKCISSVKYQLIIHTVEVNFITSRYFTRSELWCDIINYFEKHISIAQIWNFERINFAYGPVVLILLEPSLGQVEYGYFVWVNANTWL